MLSWVEINTDKLRANIDAFQSLAQPGTAVMVVVKANAYGHGLKVVAPIAAERAAWLGVNSVEEALDITALGIHKPVAILGHSSPDELETVVRNEYRQVVYRLDVARGLSEAARKLGKSAQVHLKIETGTNRQGLPLPDLVQFVRSIRDLPGLHIEGIYTHFANIEDTLDPSFAQSQLQRFRQALALLDSIGVRPPIIHAAATSGALLYPETGFSMVRIGIGAYGIWPSRETQLAARERGRLVALSPVLTWKTRVAQIKNVNAGEYVGYGLTYRASRPMRLVVVPVGYYDGYDRKLSNSGRALIQGQLVSVVGRVAMNMFMLDVTDVGADLDDEVVLIGRQKEAEIRVEEMSERAGTIPYETLSRINPILPRIAYGSR
jgi:alanine racemase